MNIWFNLNSSSESYIYAAKNSILSSTSSFTLLDLSLAILIMVRVNNLILITLFILSIDFWLTKTPNYASWIFDIVRIKVRVLVTIISRNTNNNMYEMTLSVFGVFSLVIEPDKLLNLSKIVLPLELVEDAWLLNSISIIELSAWYWSCCCCPWFVFKVCNSLLF